MATLTYQEEFETDVKWYLTQQNKNIPVLAIITALLNYQPPKTFKTLWVTHIP